MLAYMHTRAPASSRAHVRGAYTRETMHVTKFALVCNVYETSPLLAAGHEMPAFDRSEKSWRSRGARVLLHEGRPPTHDIFSGCWKSRELLFLDYSVGFSDTHRQRAVDELPQTPHRDEHTYPKPRLHFTSPNQTHYGRSNANPFHLLPAGYISPWSP